MAKTSNRFMLAHYYEQGKVNPTGWYASEKFNGMRAQWDPERQCLVSRYGSRIYAPDFWIDQSVPKDMWWDGELIIPGKPLQDTLSVVRRKSGGSLWLPVRFYVFDQPDYPFRTFITREYEYGMFAGRVVFTRVENHEHLMQMHREVKDRGGEGLMIRHPDAAYEYGKRSRYLLKVKVAEVGVGTVVGVEPGKHGIASLLVRYNGVTFSIGTGYTQAERVRLMDNPPIDQSVVFEYKGFTKYGCPVEASYQRIGKE